MKTILLYGIWEKGRTNNYSVTSDISHQIAYVLGMRQIYTKQMKNKTKELQLKTEQRKHIKLLYREK